MREQGRAAPPAWIGAALVIGAFAGLLWLERRRPLRGAVESKNVRLVRNLAIAAIGAAAVRVIEKPVVEPAAAWVARGRRGLLRQLRLPGWAETPLALAAMDYTLYLWHILLHRVPLLWRCHLAHHADLDLDASTALRFHFAELVLSVPWRAAQVLVIGVSPRALRIWQTATLLSVLFHHSNLRLPARLERRLSRVLATPRVHGIHHSIVPEETGSNFSSGLMLWDLLHGTLRLNVPQQAITIGVPDYRKPAEVTLGRILAMPFGAVRTAWRLPGGATPERRPLPAPRDRLAA